MNKPVCWWVLSPEYETGGDWYEPPEPTRDVLPVFTISAHRAKVLAIRAWRRGWWRGCRVGKPLMATEPYIVKYYDENPMAKLTVERINLNE
jgi:hypothetical protein